MIWYYPVMLVASIRTTTICVKESSLFSAQLQGRSSFVLTTCKWSMGSETSEKI